MNRRGHHQAARRAHAIRAARAHSRVRECGFTLIELMIAITLSLIAFGAIGLVFGGTSTNRSSLERSDRLTENAYYATDLIVEEARLAGYYAEVSFVGVAWQVPDPCTTALAAQGWSVAPFNAPVPISGYRGTEAAPLCLANRKAGTGVVVLRRLEVDPTPLAQATGDTFLQVSKCAADPAATPWVIGSTPAAFTLRNLDCATTADVRRLVVRVYYVATCNECGIDTVPTLKRAEIVGGAVVISPLAEGVENLQVEYAFDTDGDGNADEWLDGLSGVGGAADNDWSNVVGMRMHVLTRTSDLEPGYADTTKSFDLGPAGITPPANDGYKRVLLNSVARLNNPAGWRETP